MTKLVADEKCSLCGGQLVPPALAPMFTRVAGADYVCVKCGRSYHWVGNPPKLVLLEDD